MALRQAPYAHRAYPNGGAREAVLEALETNMGAEMTAHDVARLARVRPRTAKEKLVELRELGMAHSRRAVTLYGCPLLWSRVAI
jgi:hypothetical protein